MTRCDPLIEPLVDDLHANTKLRVWSLVITIFGDAVLPRGGRVSMQDLLAITRHAGIEPGGLRTAISRLSKDGWIEVEKRGRNSFYTLSQQGMREFIPATQVIYNSSAVKNPENWLVAIAPPSGTGIRRETMKKLEMLKPSFVHSGLAFWPTDRAPASIDFRNLDCLTAIINQDSPPNWLVEQVATPDVRNSYVSLIELLHPIHENVDVLHELKPLDALTARILLIHHWRKLALRGVHIPGFLRPKNWPDRSCEIMVASIYRALLDNSEQYWPEPLLPKVMHELKSRFSEAI